VVRLRESAWRRKHAFLDAVHFDAEQHDELGRALAEELLKLLGGPRGPRTTP
jgi:lysophospholipase L1-like esterase